ncbi:hypothetical protein [Micromonospora coerulea]|uniref:hypothetical protein n=1 Tax=Micromonospora coerulea TaxID=47856 RepID=UPI0019053A22|nr:hypothetical protein [Micromonospora veneta]
MVTKGNARQVLKAQTTRRAECLDALADAAEAAFRDYWTDALADAESLIRDAEMEMAR